MKLRMHDRLTELMLRCRLYHVPQSKNEDEKAAQNKLCKDGMGIVDSCEYDKRLQHVTFPDDWRMVDDVNARSADDPRDIGSVVIVRRMLDGSEESLASFVSGDDSDRHDYGLVLP